MRRAARSTPGSGGENVILTVPRSVLEETENDGGERLSGREQEILLLAARGLSNRRISDTLHISEATVKRHLANVYEKMGVGSRGEAAREALMRDWITIEEIKESPGKDGA